MSELSRRQRGRLQDELLAVYALYAQYGAAEVLAAMARADDAGTYSADALALLLATPRAVAPAPPPLPRADLPPQAEVDRLLSVYEAWVHVDVALPDGRAGQVYMEEEVR